MLIMLALHCCFVSISRSILDGYKLILTSLLVSMGISTFTSKEFFIFCRASKIGNAMMDLYGG